MKDISIIIVNYNVKEFLLNLIDSIKKASEGLTTEIIIVDNASVDGSVELIRENYPDVILIENEKNLGFGKANNIGLERATGKYLLMINPDTIVREDTFRKMISFFEKHPDAGMAGCKVLNPNGTLQLACRRSFPGPWTSLTKVTGLSTLFPNSKLFAKYNLTYLDENKTYEVDAISGSFMMMKRETYEKVGGFDPQFFMYGEDLDLCYRVQQAGYKVYYVHETEIIHYKGESTKRSSIDETKVFYDAMHLFVKKHLSSSFIVEWILRTAIFVRRLFAFGNHFRLPLTACLLDFLIFSAALYAAEKIYISNTTWVGFPEEIKPWIYFIPAFFQVIISFFSGAYKRENLSLLRSIIALFFGAILLSAMTFFLKQFAFSRAVVLITYTFAFVGFSLWRIIAKLGFKIGISLESRGGNTVVVGTGPTSAELAAKLKSNFTNVYHVVGLIGKSIKDFGNEINGFKVVGSLENINKVITEKKIKKVIFSSEEISFNEMFSVVAKNRDEEVSFLFSGSRMDYLVGKSSVTMLDDIPLLKVNYNISVFIHRLSKRMLDLFLSFFILLFIYPFIYLASKVLSNKGEFFNFILRTPEVFSGKLSFVGPRSNSYYGDLFIGKKGLTGYWFTEIYDRSDEEEETKLNIYYARNQSVWLDLEILGKTFSKMFIKTEK